MVSRDELTARYEAAVEPLVKNKAINFTSEDASRFLEPWLNSMVFSKGSLLDGVPWMTFPAIEFLESLLTPESKVFEFGAGGSTVFLASRVGELASVEHDEGWFQETSLRMEELLKGMTLRWRAIMAIPSPRELDNSLDPSDPLSYSSSDSKAGSASFHAYAAAIDEFDDRHFDVVIIDGRARPACFHHAIAKVRIGGYVVLDNAERAHYQWIEQTAAKLGFEKTEFWGPGPYNPYVWRTIFLRRVRSRFGLNELDVRLEEFVDFDNGVFVEAGANDGIRQSNTYHLEACRGWRGLLVEALPKAFEDCRRNRPSAKTVWAALGSPSQAGGKAKLRSAGLMSVVRGSLQTIQEEDAHIAAGQRTQNLGFEEDVEAPFSTLSEILDDQGSSHVDLLILDIEGAEASALEGLDFSRHRPRLILVEARYRADVEKIITPLYRTLCELSHHDVLYELVSNDCG